MSSAQELPALLASLQNALKLQSALMAKFEQRETVMQTSFNQRMQALQGEVALVHRRVDDIVGGASVRIAKEAHDAMAPIAAHYGRDVSATSAQLQKASRTVWLWFGAAGAILLLVLLVGWVVLAYYRRELAVARDELQRYENAIPAYKRSTPPMSSSAAVGSARTTTRTDNGRAASGSTGRPGLAHSRKRPTSGATAPRTPGCRSPPMDFDLGKIKGCDLSQPFIIGLAAGGAPQRLTRTCYTRNSNKSRTHP